MNWVAENIELFLPRYLSDDTKNNLVDSLKQFPDNIDQRFYLGRNIGGDPILQGDGIGSLTVCHIPRQKFYSAPCIVVSNSCDVDPSNERHTPVNICYAPIIRLAKYRDSLVEKYGEEKADSVVEAIRKQYITHYFYLPAGAGLDYEGIVLLDQVTNAPNSTDFYDTLQEERLFILSQYGFYLFLFKLSVHFTRMGERLDRDADQIVT
ncbi:MAG: hypothetical protein KAI66_19540 [Lentisphaeria bacterium]|nr:hypothetical protein [Lentisphaeria bacterium]